MGIFDRKPWDWDPERDDPDRNGKNDEYRSEEDKLFEHELSDFEIDEIEQKFNDSSKVKSFLEMSKEAKDDYEQKINNPAVQLMLAQLTGWFEIFENSKVMRLMEIAQLAGTDFGLSLDELNMLLQSNLKLTDRVNMSVMTAIAAAQLGIYKDKTKEQLVLNNYKKQRDHFAKAGDMALTGFMLNLGELRMWIGEMELKHKVYEEISELEKTPIPEK